MHDVSPIFVRETGMITASATVDGPSYGFQQQTLRISADLNFNGVIDQGEFVDWLMSYPGQSAFAYFGVPDDGRPLQLSNGNPVSGTGNFTPSDSLVVKFEFAGIEKTKDVLVLNAPPIIVGTPSITYGSNASGTYVDVGIGRADKGINDYHKLKVTFGDGVIAESGWIGGNDGCLPTSVSVRRYYTSPITLLPLVVNLKDDDTGEDTRTFAKLSLDINNNDSNLNTVEDLSDSGFADPDIKSVSGLFPQVTSNLGTFRLHYSPYVVRVWTDQSKSQLVLPYGGIPGVSNGVAYSGQTTLWVEGYGPGESSIYVTFEPDPYGSYGNCIVTTTGSVWTVSVLGVKANITNDANHDTQLTNADDEIEDTKSTRIFVNHDDDNRNGFADTDDAQVQGGDDDLAQTKLELGISAGTPLAGLVARLTVPDKLKAYGTISKGPLAGGTANGNVYEWKLDELYGPGYVFDLFPLIVYMEGTEKGDYRAKFEILQNGAVKSTDTAGYSVENIVWPYVNPPAGYQFNSTATWVGTKLSGGSDPTEAKAWWISKPLIQYIIAPTDLGFIETVHPDQMSQHEARTERGLVKARADNKGELSESTQSYGTNGFRATINYEFTLRDTNGYVQGIGKNGRISFVGNSGLKFGGKEVAIFDIHGMFDEAGTTLAASTQDNGFVDLATPNYNGEHLKTLMGAVVYNGKYEKMLDNPNRPQPPVDKAAFHATHQNNKSKQKPQGQIDTLVIDVSKNISATPQRWQIQVYLNDKLTYLDKDFDITGLSTIKLQSHWGSGVKFVSMEVTDPWGLPPTQLPKLKASRFDDLGINRDPSKEFGVNPSGPRYGKDFHWLDNNLDGVITPQQEDLDIPAAFVRGSAPAVSAKFVVPPGIRSTTTDIEIRGFGTGGLVFPAKAVSLSPSGEFLYSGTSTTSLPNEVKHFENFEITWEAKADDLDWTVIGKSKGDVYLTLAQPTTSPLWHTVVHLGSHFAQGATTEDEVITMVWQNFQVLAVKKQDVTYFVGSVPVPDAGKPLEYWTNYVGTGSLANTQMVLHSALGSCGAFASLFVDTVKAQGIDRQDEIVYTDTDSLVIKSWTPVGPQVDVNGTLLDVAVYVPAEDDGNVNNMLDTIYTPQRNQYVLNANTQLTRTPGIPGQNAPNPRADFLGHVWVRYVIGGQMRWLDPSYGIEYLGANDTARTNSFEDQSVYGFAQANIPDLELKLNADLDGDGQITNDAGMDSDYVVKQLVVRRQSPNVKETTIKFKDQ
jgi:hypothetical protein